jgi:phosphonoacetaldehyde hydrolase
VQRLKLVVFDWAGTIADHGCFAPVAAFLQAFAQHGIEVTATQARGPMGLHKRDHIRQLLQMPEIAARWRTAHDRDWNEQDVNQLYRHFIPLQLETIGSYCRLVPGFLACVERLRTRGCQIGTTTGYFREAAERVYEAARDQGFAADCDLCADDVPAGRPAPWMIFRIMEMLNVYPPAVVVKIGDTVPDIQEGLNAGVWSIGVTRTGNEVGCCEDEWANLPGPERQTRLAKARTLLLDAEAHAVIESIADLSELVDELEARLHRGEKP